MLKADARLSEFLSLERLMGPRENFAGTRLGKLTETLSNQKFGERAPIKRMPHYWDASHFGFDRVRLFRELSEERKSLVLSILTNHYLGESSFIEKMGFGFNAKMMLMSDSIEEKTLYSAFALDEAKHLQMILRYLPETPTDGYRDNPFLALIGEAIRVGDRDSLVLFIQVLLEGFGMAHYKWLHDGCLHGEFKLELAELLRDEAFHHGSGSLLAGQARFAPASEMISDFIPKMIDLLHGWMHPHLTALSIAAGGLTTDQKTRALEELDYATQTAEKFGQLKGLLLFPATRGFIDSLEEMGIFKTTGARACAEAHAL